MNEAPASWTSIVATCPAAEQIVGPWRLELDPSARHGLPAHITLLAPFVPAQEIRESDYAAVGDVWAEHAPLDPVLTHVEQLPGAIALRPDPQTERALAQVTNALLRHWPQLRGTVRTGFSRPHHLTVACREDEALRAAIASDLAQYLPLSAPLEPATVVVAAASGEIRRLPRIPSAF